LQTRKINFSSSNSHNNSQENINVSNVSSLYDYHSQKNNIQRARKEEKIVDILLNHTSKRGW
jgi:hypothetical protein